MKKLIILLLALTLIIGAFISCQKKYFYIDAETSTENMSAATSEKISDETNASVETTENIITLDTIETIDGTDAGGTSEGLDTTQYPTEYNYTLTKINNQWYMVWNDYWDNESENSALHYEKIKISSMDALKNAVPQGDLGDGKAIFFMKYVNADNYTQVPFYDVEHIWQPSFPDKWSFETEVYLYNGYYEFMGIGESRNGETEIVSVAVLRKDDYNVILNNLQTSEDYSNLQNEKRIVNYEYSYEEISDSAYHIYDMLIEQSNCYARIYIQTFEELTDDQILAFGFEEYLG